MPVPICSDGMFVIWGTGVQYKRMVLLQVESVFSRPEYRMYVDEVGEDHMRVFENDGQRYLSLTGVILELDYAGSVLTEAFDRLKREFFSDHHPDDPVIFHRADMKARRGPFCPLEDADTNDRFNRALIEVIEDTKFTVITAGIDKESHKQHYVDPAHPYHYLLEVLMERYVKFLERFNSRGDILVEGRGLKQNRQLNDEYQNLYNNGNGTFTARAAQRRLSKSSLMFKRKDQNVAGLQLTDMVAFPSHRYLVCREQDRDLDAGFTSKVVDILLADKYRRRYDGRVEGWGTKWLT